jgi:DNA anti-recombination protein RmuC
MSDAMGWVLLVLVTLEGAVLVALLARSGRSGRAGTSELRDELRLSREEAARAASAQREEISRGIAASNETLRVTLGGMAEMQHAQLDGLAKGLRDLSDSNQASLNTIRLTVDARVRELREGNERSSRRCVAPWTRSCSPRSRSGWASRSSW